MTVAKVSRVLKCVALAASLVAAPAIAQESASTQIGNSTVTVGGGTAILTLPDVTSMVTRTANIVPFPISESFKFSDDFDKENGWNYNGSIETPIGAGNTLVLSGFWARIDGDHGFSCTGANAVVAVPLSQQNCFIMPLVDDPAVNQIGGSTGITTLVSNAEREVDQWGGSLESKWFMAPDIMGVTRAPNRRYLALGADVRGIDQDLDVLISGSNGTVATYNEDLDTTYYGAFLAYGGHYSPLLFRGIWEKLGLQSSFRLQGGVYYANTDYAGRLSQTPPFVAGGGNPSGNLSLSSDDAAFIGGITLETRKHIGRRAFLSLKSDYEYYSWVPDMAYNNTDTSGVPGLAVANAQRQVGTAIGDDDAFSFRTSLRLTIKLGPDDVFE